MLGAPFKASNAIEIDVLLAAGTIVPIILRAINNPKARYASRIV